MRRKIASITQLYRLPATCSLCNALHQNSFAVCTSCHTYLTPLGSACSICATSLPDNTTGLCGLCSTQKPILDKVITGYRFEEPLRTLLHDFKYRSGLYLTTYLSKLMLDALPKEGYHPDCLVPVPMHPKRICKRGFNQAAELAKHLSRHIKVPYDLTLCRKRINTEPQAQQNAKMRRTNLKNSFTSKAFHYQHITLVDDLMTTGSTAYELALLLKQQGAIRVDLWCCARATGF